MSYQEELQAKLDAVRSTPSSEKSRTLDTTTLEEQLVQEIESELTLSQYDLDESDILRSIKILEILHTYPDVFSNHKALTILYALAKSDMLQAANLYRLSGIDIKTFKKIINTMAKHKLIVVNSDKEIELTSEGMSLAERIGVDVYI